MQKAIKRYFPVFVLPTLIAFTIGFLAPFVLGVYLSFCKFTTGRWGFPSLSLVYCIIYDRNSITDQHFRFCGSNAFDKED